MDEDATKMADVEAGSDSGIGRDTDSEQDLDKEIQNPVNDLQDHPEPTGSQPAGQPTESVDGDRNEPELGRCGNARSPGSMNALHRIEIPLKVSAQRAVFIAVRGRGHHVLNGSGMAYAMKHDTPKNRPSVRYQTKERVDPGRIPRSGVR